jgi:predicted ATPase
MLKDIKGISFKGAFFDSETTLQLFSQAEADRVCLIFGRNGSGKSTISRAILKAAGHEEVEDIASAKFVDSTDAVKVITEEELKKVFVFNEDYTNSRVRLKEDGLSTIVMFGELVDIADKIEIAETALVEA